MTQPPDLDALRPAQLKQLVLELFDENVELKRIIAEFREEITQLKGLKGRPRIARSGIEKGTEPKPMGKRSRRRRRGKIVPKLSVQECILKIETPAGSRLKGYEDFLVQDLVLRARAIRYRRERWLTPEERTVIAPLPPDISGHFGAELRRFVLLQHHQGQVTVPRLVAQLQAIGVSISKRQVMRLLLTGPDGFLAEAGGPPCWSADGKVGGITVDDAGARHKAANGFCAQIGNDGFARLGTPGSKRPWLCPVA